MTSQIKKLFCIISCLSIGISVFLPFISFSFLGTTTSATLVEADQIGIVIIVAAVLALVCSLVELPAVNVLVGGFGLAMSFVKWNNLTARIADESVSFAAQMLNKGPGYYCLLIGSIALIVFSLIPTANQ